MTFSPCGLKFWVTTISYKWRFPVKTTEWNPVLPIPFSCIPRGDVGAASESQLVHLPQSLLRPTDRHLRCSILLHILATFPELSCIQVCSKLFSVLPVLRILPLDSVRFRGDAPFLNLFFWMNAPPRRDFSPLSKNSSRIKSVFLWML